MRSRIIVALNTAAAAALFAALQAFAGPPGNDTCASALAISEGTSFANTTAADNSAALTCGDSAASADIFFSFTPDSDCFLVLDTCGSGYDSVLSVHDGCPTTDGNQLACNDDFDCDGDGSVSDDGYVSGVALPAQGGLTYVIRVAGWQGATGAVTLNLACDPLLEADTCAGAAPITDGQFYAATSGATLDGFSACDANPGPDVWFSYTPLEDCTLTASACGSGFDAVLSVHDGCPDGGAELGCNTGDACGAQSAVTLSAVSGVPLLIRAAGQDGAAGILQLNIDCGVDGADVLIGEINEMAQFGREGDLVACGIESPVCNAGTQPLDWYPLDDGRHPFMVFNMYRLEDERFEQIGGSWVKHGFGSAQLDTCGLGCIPWPDATRTGVGCSDTYNAATNANQNFLGPRHEINPWNGDFTFEGSYLDGFPGGLGELEHRLVLADEDLDPAQHAGAQYFCELYVAAHDDVDHMNSIAWEPVSVSGAPGGTWDFGVGFPSTNIGPAVQAWPGALLSTVPQQSADDGRCILAAKATDNGNGTWHYEYALYNHDMDREVRSFGVPVDPDATLTNVGFHAPDIGDNLYTADAWAASQSSGQIAWSTGSFAAHPQTNPLRWGLTYTFRFDADRPPLASLAVLGLYKPGAPDELTGATIGPGAASCSVLADCADTDSNGVRDDNCVWWACANGACAGTAIAFADMGGAFGGCPPDGVADGHDRFHALNCFSDTSASGQSGYPCEAAPPAALNVDAGGPFGSCPPDGVCDGNDAFHALNSFEGSSACSCPSGGPGPAPALPPAEAVRAELSLEPDQARIRPGQLLRVDVRLVTPVDGLRGYQLHAAAHGGRSGSCKLVDMAVEDRPDEVFAGLGPWRAFNVGIAQMVAGLDGPGVRAPKRAYLATLIFQVSADAAGRFTIELLADEADPEQRTFLFPADPQTRIDVAAAPVEITIGAKRRERSSQAR